METWKNIEGFEGKYEVSNYGRVRSIARMHPSKPIPIKGRIMKPFFSGGRNREYLFVIIQRVNPRINKSFSIHRLVAVAFVQNPSNKAEVNHKDGNKQNNRWDNLEWCTRKENVQHSSQSGLLRHDGVHFNAKLSLEEVRQIKIKLSKGVRQGSLAKEYNANTSTIHNISKGKSWKHVII